MKRPVLLQIGSLPAWDEAPLAEAFEVLRLFEAEDRAAFLAEHGPRVRAAATRGDLGADAALIAACPTLEIVSVHGVGFDAVDPDACHARGIRVTNTPDVLTGDVFVGEPTFDPRLREVPNLLLQPHHGSGTVETRKDMGKLMGDNLTAHFAVQPLPAPAI